MLRGAAGQSPQPAPPPHLLQASSPSSALLRSIPQFTSQIRGTDSSWGGKEGKAQAHRERERD